MHQNVSHDRASADIGHRPTSGFLRASSDLRASTDANVPIGLGIPAIAIGAGGGRGGETHTTREWFENRDGALGIVRAMVIVIAAAELA